MSVKHVDEYIALNHEYSFILKQFREVALSEGLEETIKWMSPVYMHNRKNIIGFNAFKNHAAIWFYEGVYLSHPKNILVSGKQKQLL